MEETDKKEYEISFLLRREEDVEAVLKQLQAIGGEVITEGQLASIKLAYPIKKETSAYFGSIHFSAEPLRLKEMSNVLKLDNRILRHLVITPPVLRMERRPRLRPTEDRPAPESAKPPVEVSNEELEKKLEEILN